MAAEKSLESLEESQRRTIVAVLERAKKVELELADRNLLLDQIREIVRDEIQRAFYERSYDPYGY